VRELRHKQSASTREMLVQGTVRASGEDTTTREHSKEGPYANNTRGHEHRSLAAFIKAIAGALFANNCKRASDAPTRLKEKIIYNDRFERVWGPLS